MTYPLCYHRLCVEVLEAEREKMKMMRGDFWFGLLTKKRLYLRDVSPPIMTNKHTHTRTHSLTHTDIQILPCLQYIKKCMSCISDIFKPLKQRAVFLDFF